ncbi:RNA polymerase sigma factor [Verrucomicrobium spinosum]|uniref:RNA polymerase sigma factor n=1 Tax=Verrucomicrobium spinosum TaxID=2736 RepID=UPI0001745135|nr:sigma-70 family RNA polymerase sigma factor [Verrucomicrobium spinosum]
MSESGTSDPSHLAHVHQLFVSEMVALRGFLRALVRERALVDDLVQDTFLTVTSRAASYQEGTNFRAWLFTIARFKVLESFRKSGAPPEALRLEVVEALTEKERDFGAVDERVDHLTACIERLAPKAKLAIEMRYQQSLRPPEIASAMRLSTGAVKVALMRARDTLRLCIERRIVSKPL